LNITLTRLYNTDECMLGVMATTDKLLCFTMENPWRGNQKGISCIPDGHYWCKPHEGTKFKETWVVMDVPGRSGIVFHIGNTESDTRGCILPGSTTGTLRGERAVLGSRIAMEKLRNNIGLSTGFDLTIKRV